MITYPRGVAQKPPRPLSPINIATPDDIADLAWFLHAMHSEIDGGRADEEVLMSLANAFVHKNGGVAFIVRGRSHIEASMGIKTETSLLSRAGRLRVAWNCVLPEARVTGHAKSLLIRARELADSLGRELLLEELTPDPEAGKAKLAARHLKPVGQMFRHVPEVA